MPSLVANPLARMKLTTDGERCIDEMVKVVAAKGFEADT